MVAGGETTGTTEKPTTGALEGRENRTGCDGGLPWSASFLAPLQGAGHCIPHPVVAPPATIFCPSGTDECRPCERAESVGDCPAKQAPRFCSGIPKNSVSRFFPRNHSPSGVVWTLPHH